MTSRPEFLRSFAASARAILDPARSEGMASSRLMLALGLMVAVVGVGTMIVQPGPDGGAATAAAAAAAEPDETTEAATSPAEAKETVRPRPTRRTTKSRLRALRHPLVGTSRQKVITRLGPPTRRTTEGGAAMELLEYEIADNAFQLVLLNKRVVEVNRFR